MNFNNLTLLFSGRGVIYPPPRHFEFRMIYCQAQSQLQLNWTELVLFSINAHKLHIFQHNCPYHLQPNPQTPILDYFYLLCKWEFVCLYNDLYRMDGEMIEFNKWIKTTCLCLFFWFNYFVKTYCKK